MFKLNLKIALRNLWKHKGYTAINVLGLSIGLASCILIFVFIHFQLNYDKGYKNADRIYRVVTEFKYDDGNDFKTQGVPLPLTPAMRNDFPQLEKIAAIQLSGGTLKVKAQAGRPELKVSASVFYAEPSFFEIFDYQWLAGHAAQSLTAPNLVVLSEETANNYFGDWRKAIGNTINFDNKTDFKVSGIIKDNPKNSSFPLKVIFSYASFNSRNLKNWGSVSSDSECYALLKTGISIHDLEKPLAQFIKKYYTQKSPGKSEHHFQPLKDIHFSEGYRNFAQQSTPYSQLIGLGVIGLFLLLTACINFINLATAQAVSRGKEVGVRKVMGSRRKQLITQFLSETALITFIALLLACVLSELSLPRIENLFSGNIELRLFGHPVIFLFLGVLFVLVSFLAGFYPALIMSGFSPALAIKNKIAANSGGIALRKTLVVVQFAITAILIVSTLIIIRQMSFIRNKSLGFDKEAIALINLPTDSISLLKFETYKHQLVNYPGVKNVSFCSAAPMSGNNNESNFSYNKSTDEPFQVNTKIADEAYFKTFGLRIIAGRELSRSDTIKEFVVNETLLKKVNEKDPKQAIGKILRYGGGSGPIVGVVKDFNNHSLHDAISPIAIFSFKPRFSTVALKMEASKMVDIIRKAEETFNASFPDYVFEKEFFDESVSNAYETEHIMGTLFKAFATVVIFISFIGLFGLISFVATQRTKEIAIRRVLGASTLELVKMLNSTFLWMVLAANVIAWPLAYIFIQKWLSGFEYRISLNIWPFLLAMCISMIITLLTVSLRSYRAAKANTIDALKYE